MFVTMSLVTSIKDYIEVVHKLVETDPTFKIGSYYDFGSILTFLILSGKELLQNILTFQWFHSFWSIPTLVPNIASAMISEISVFDGYLQNTQAVFENPISYGDHNFFVYCTEKFMIGLLNSVFLCLPTSISHIITLRRFVMQGLEAGFLSGLGTIAGNILWIGSIVFGLRFVVIPWLSLDLFRAFLGFVLIVKYMWDSYTERRTVVEDFSKYKIFLFTFLLSFTEQTTIYPFLSNLSVGSDSTIFESFPVENFAEFSFVHFSYLLGIFIGSLSLLQFTCWFWENPAFQIYMWLLSSFKTTTTLSSKIVNLLFLYLTMICAISNVAYFGLDYTLTNPLGFVHEDRLFEQKALLETSFLNTKASDRNTRRNRGRHGRRERWKRRVRRYRTFDASLYDQGVYDLFTLEDLNYGFDRFWLRRKIRNHRVRFRFFPGPWMRSFKKQLSRPRLESFMGPRVEFFRILFEQSYHPEFHEFSTKKNLLQTKKNQSALFSTNEGSFLPKSETRNSIYWNSSNGRKKERLFKENSTLRKFVRKVKSRIQVAKIETETKNPQNFAISFENSKTLTAPISSKAWKSFSTQNPLSTSVLSATERKNASNASLFKKSEENFLFQRFYKKLFFNKEKSQTLFGNADESKLSSQTPQNEFTLHLSKKDRFLERYRNFLQNSNEKTQQVRRGQKEKNTTIFSFDEGKDLQFLKKSILPLTTEPSQPSPSFEEDKRSQQNFTSPSQANLRLLQNESQYRPITLLHPLTFYFQKEKALKRKFQFYGVKLFRNFGVENNAPYFRVMMKRFFYHYKPTLRWERTMRVATMRRARRKSSRIPRKFNLQKTSQIVATQSLPFFGENISEGFEVQQSLNQSEITKPTHFYSLVEKRASRYRSQIYKDVLQHWYYSPLNRFLVKVDVDSFIRRQPNSYFLTKTDEKFLHLKRQLLSEYYETLRWYTYMQHYSAMKNQIGGTKSLSSRAYNQQFVGTFKKIRHLFNITPSFRESPVLKFDQPLFHEYKNSQGSSIFNQSILHEELLADDFFFLDTEKKNSGGHEAGENFSPQGKTLRLPDDLPTQSAKILREYLREATPLRQNYIEALVQEKNYWDLTKFFFKGQKIRGTNPVTNETDFLKQEKNVLFTSNFQEPNFVQDKVRDELWLTLFKKCQNKLYDQEALKNYVTLKKEKYETKKQKHEKYFKNRLERMKDAYLFQSLNKNAATQPPSAFDFENFSGYTSSVQKAMKESIFWEKNSLETSSFDTVEKFFVKKNFLQKLNIRNNRPNLYASFQAKTNLLEQNGDTFQLPEKLRAKISPQINSQKLQSLLFTTNFKNSFKTKALEILDAENFFSQKFSERKDRKKSFRQNFGPLRRIHKFLWTSLRFKQFSHFPDTRSPMPMSSQEISEKIPFFSKLFSFGKYSFLGTPTKNLDFWKKRENALSKRRKIRKTLKRLRNQKAAPQKIFFEKNEFFNQNLPTFKNTRGTTASRQKIDNLGNAFETSETQKKQDRRRSQSWKKYSSFRPQSGARGESLLASETKKSFLQTVFEKGQHSLWTKQFQRKRSRLRRYSSFKGRGPIKKRTLREKFKRQFKSLKKYGGTLDSSTSQQMKVEREKKKIELIQLITQRTSASKILRPEEQNFQKRQQKQRRTRQIKHRSWKKKKQNFAQKRRKLRKRRRSTIAKIRVLNKKLHRILSKNEIQTWWWQIFFPTFQKTTEKNWQLEKNLQIRKELFDLSEKEILERDQSSVGQKEGSSTSSNFINSLQIGDKDYKPLAIPQAFRIREKLIQNEILRFGHPQLEKSPSRDAESTYPSTNETSVPSPKETLKNSQTFSKTEEKSQNFVESLTKNIATNQAQNFQDGKPGLSDKFFVGTNPIPFYAGWDESLRKFVITNRLLSRKDAFSFSSTGMNAFFHASNNQSTSPFQEFSKAPLQGMNAATTLYWQIPFTTYDPDQFFALGMDGFSPLGWRNFSLKHSKQTTKPILVKNFFSFKNASGNFSQNLQVKFFENAFQKQLFGGQNCTPSEHCFNQNEFEKIKNLGFSTDFKTKPQKAEIDKNFEYRRIMKKQKRIKKHPRPPVWFPSGSLSQQLLPVHYIYVFYKRSRLPRDRYIRRRLKSTFVKTGNSTENPSPNSTMTKILDFTLRKRTKPRRKYHRKRFVFDTNQFFLRRRKFRSFLEDPEVGRPTSKIFEISAKQEKRTLQSKQRRKIASAKQSSENLRVRQLRRRVQRQVFRPIWRYRPRSGGFVWPGDYLRFELVKAPELNSSQTFASSLVEPQEKTKAESSSRKIRKKKRRTLQEWQIQPKKYLLEKHNLQVFKKRIEKSNQNLKS